MKTRKTWRNGLGLSQLMAMMLVVLPTMAFIVTFLLDYWGVMQADYKLKLLANQVAEVANNQTDISNFTMVDRGLCPNGAALSFGTQDEGGGAGYIDITIQYNYNGTYLTNKNLSTSVSSYSYHDQNMSIIGTCS